MKILNAEERDQLKQEIGRNGPVRIEHLPAGLKEEILSMLKALAEGEGADVEIVGAWIPIHKAADILNAHTDYVKKLIRGGELTRVKSRDGLSGKIYQVSLEELIGWKEKDDRKREKAMNELVRQSGELGLYDTKEDGKASR